MLIKQYLNKLQAGSKSKIKGAPTQEHISIKQGDSYIRLPFWTFFLDEAYLKPPKKGKKWHQIMFWLGFVGILIAIMYYYLAQ